MISSKTTTCTQIPIWKSNQSDFYTAVKNKRLEASRPLAFFISLTPNATGVDYSIHEARKVVDIIHIEQWYYTQKGLYAPEGGKNLAPRQYQRRLRPGKVTYDDVFKSVSEYRQAYSEKAVIYSGASAPENGKAVMDAGGSCPNVK